MNHKTTRKNIDTYKNECPTCHSRRVKKKKPGVFEDNMKKPSNFKLTHDRQCRDCGTVWSPGCSRGEAMFAICAGAGLLLGAVVVISFGLYSFFEWADNERRFEQLKAYLAFALFFLGIPGTCALVLGTRVISGKSGAVEIHMHQQTSGH